MVHIQGPQTPWTPQCVLGRRQSTYIFLFILGLFKILFKSKELQHHNYKVDTKLHENFKNSIVAKEAAPIPKKQTSLFRLRDVLDDLVFVSGFWQVDGNPKHDVSFYESGVFNTLQALTTLFWPQSPKITFLHNVLPNTTLYQAFQSFSKQVLFVFETTPQRYQTKAIELAKLCQRQSTDIMDNCKKGNKPAKHFHRLEDSSLDIWSQILNVWISKLHFLNVALEQNPSKQYFSWIDGGLAGRINMTSLPFVQINSDSVWMRGSSMCFNGTPIAFRGGLIISRREPLIELITSFYATLETILVEQINLCWDEESIITRLYHNTMNEAGFQNIHKLEGI